MDSGGKALKNQRSRENELLLAVAEGDMDALRDLYRSFERPLYTLGMRWLSDPELAEELVQEVTIRVWRRAPNFDPARGASSSWIFGVARNVAADLAAKRKRDPVPVAESWAVESDPWDEESAWKAWQVSRAMRTLPTDQRRVLELAYVGQLTQTEIARALDLPLGTVKTRMYAGLRRLRASLTEMGIVEEDS
jgi:RNA polymerase sigma-70 factor (ECF subfamily)